jgi:hypothetical protein
MGKLEEIIEKYADATKRNAAEIATMPISFIRQNYREFAEEVFLAASQEPAPMAYGVFSKHGELSGYGPTAADAEASIDGGLWEGDYIAPVYAAPVPPVVVAAGPRSLNECSDTPDNTASSVPMGEDAVEQIAALLLGRVNAPEGEIYKVAREIAALSASSVAKPCGVKALPERDTSNPAENQGLFRKFEVRRTDGSDAPGGKHYECRYFVLDVDHDPYAIVALSAYASACESTHPALALDLREKWGARGPVNASLLKRLRQYEGHQSETTACYNGLRDEAADVIACLSHPAQGWREPIICDVLTMQHSSGFPDYFTRITLGERSLTTFMSKIKGRCEYHAAEFDWLLNGTPKPRILDFDDTEPEGLSEYLKSVALPTPPAGGSSDAG